MFNDVQPRWLSGTYHRIMFGRPFRPRMRALRLALVCGAAVLCLPATGLAGPMGISSISSVAGSRGEIDDSDNFLLKGVSRFLGVLDTDGPGAYAGATYQADELAMLADDLRARARADVARDGTGPFETGEHRWSQGRLDRADAATTVPEPGSLILFGTGLLVIAMWARGRNGTGRPSIR